jgi:hypothetical protein
MRYFSFQTKKFEQKFRSPHVAMGYAEVHFYNRIVDSQRVRMFLFYSIKICDFFLTIFFFLHFQFGNRPETL